MKDFLNQFRETADQQGGPQKAVLQKILETLKSTKVNVLVEQV